MVLVTPLWDFKNNGLKEFDLFIDLSLLLTGKTYFELKLSLISVIRRLLEQKRFADFKRGHTDIDKADSFTRPKEANHQHQ